MSTVLAAAGVTVAACSPAVQGRATSAHAVPMALGASTAGGLLAALAHSGFDVPNPVDTTKQDCPHRHCLQSVVSDTVRITSFPTSSLARRSAVPGVDCQVGRFVVRFAPPLTEEQKSMYWRQIRKLVAD